MYVRIMRVNKHTKLPLAAGSVNNALYVALPDHE